LEICSSFLHSKPHILSYYPGPEEPLQKSATPHKNRDSDDSDLEGFFEKRDINMAPTTAGPTVHTGMKRKSGKSHPSHLVLPHTRTKSMGRTMFHPETKPMYLNQF